MKILIVGSGGREHAIAWALNKTASQPLDIYCAAGNAGMAETATLVPIAAMDSHNLARFAESEAIDLTFVGPEAPLAAGIVDHFQAKGLAIVGPTASAARLESSKVFAKDFMTRNGVSTAEYRVAQSPEQAIEFLRSGAFGSSDCPVVVKADGLAAGKGVVVANSHAEAKQAIEDLMINHLAGTEAAARIVLEQALIGTEASLLLFADGRDCILMPAARDHKRIGENDTGPNTGGMGSITEHSILSDAQLAQVVKEIVEPSLIGAERDGFPFKGVLFLGLMLTANGPQLLEYNVRFGDPETQTILVRLQSDLLSVFEAIHQETLGKIKVEWTTGASACVVAANRGYPGKYETGAIIEGLTTVKKPVEIFHAGTTLSSEGKILATGGRVLGVTAPAPDLPAALEHCYRALDKIHWLGMQFRRDIGRKHQT